MREPKIFTHVHSKEGLLSILPHDIDSAETARSHFNSFCWLLNGIDGKNCSQICHNGDILPASLTIGALNVSVSTVEQSRINFAGVRYKYVFWAYGTWHHQGVRVGLRVLWKIRVLCNRLVTTFCTGRTDRAIIDFCCYLVLVCTIACIGIPTALYKI